MTESTRTLIKSVSLMILAMAAFSCNSPSGGGIGDIGGSGTVETPVISPSTGIITEFDAITIEATEGSTIRYTVDGSEPDDSSPVYSAPFTLPYDPSLQTVKAYALLDGLADSSVAMADYMVYQMVSGVEFSEVEGAIPDDAGIALSTATPGAEIYFTVDGSDPTDESAVYAAPFTMSDYGLDAMTIKAMAVLDGYSDSSVSSVSYTKAVAEAPLADRPDNATISDTMTVSFSTATAGAAIYYTLDGGDPDSASSTLYTAPFTLPVGSATVKAMATLAGYADSSVTTVNLTVEAQAAVPDADTASGFAASGTEVVLSTPSGLETIYYTLDGTDPATEGIPYASPITLTSSLTIRTYAAGTGYYPSAEAAFDYRVYAAIDSLSADSNALMADSASGPVVRAGGSWFDLISGSLTGRTVASEPAGTVLDFAIDAGGTIHAVFLVGSDLVYWNSVSGTIATTSSATVSLADAAVAVDGSGSIRIAFAQDAGGGKDEAVEAAYDGSGNLLYVAISALKNRAMGIDAVVDSSENFIIAVSEPKNTSQETRIVSYDPVLDTWTTVMDWKNNAGYPALSIDGSDVLTMAYVNPRKNELFVFDVASALASPKASVDASVIGDTRIARDSEGNFYTAAAGSAWFYNGVTVEELPMSGGPFGVVPDASGTYLMDAAGLTLYQMK